jgi:hypothetical protein
MILHVLHGDAFGGVENNFYRLIKLNKFSSQKYKILFLKSNPDIFDEINKDYFIKFYQIKKYDFNKVYFHSDFRGVYISIFLKLFTNAKIIHVAHGRLIYASNNLFIRLYLIILKYLINIFLLDDAIAVSKISGKEYFLKKFKIIDYSIFNNLIIEKNNHIKLLEPKINILHIGRYSNSFFFKNSKNHKYILKILENLNSYNIKYCITFIGGGFKNKFINDLKRVTNNNYFIKSNIIDLTPFFVESNVFIFPSKHESFGQALFFAQLFSLNCICSEVIPDEAIINNRTIKLPINNKSINLWTNSIIEYTSSCSSYNLQNSYIDLVNKFAINFINEIEK